MNKIFCKHEYELIEGNIPVHYPDYEPIKYGQIFKCSKCGKEKRILEKYKYGYQKALNKIIKNYERAKVINTNDVSDGCHTFGELYDHRAKLFSVICNQNKNISWKSKLHSDGKIPFNDKNWFVVGINTKKGQATYHYEMKYWDLFKVQELDIAPTYDGHTPEQAIERILSII